MCSLSRWRSQHSATLRTMRTGNLVFNLLCNIENSISQWRWLHASTLRTTRTKNMVQHCPQYCSQHVSVDSLHAANISYTLCAVEEATRFNVKCHEDWKHGNLTRSSSLPPAPPPLPQPQPHRRFRVVSDSNTHLSVK